MTDRSDIDDLVAAGKAAVEQAYAPYSGFRVGAAALGVSGGIYSGCNVENASFGLSVCAERAAILKAVSEGESEICAIAIANSSGQIAFPCGACRQVMAEFAPEGESMKVYLVSQRGIDEYSLDDLLPHAFELRKR